MQKLTIPKDITKGLIYVIGLFMLHFDCNGNGNVKDVMNGLHTIHPGLN